MDDNNGAIIVVIPARARSKRLKHKNRLVIGNLSLLHRTINVVSELDLISDTVVTTDDPLIAEQAKAFGVQVPNLRPKHLCQDQSLTIDVVKYILTEVGQNKSWHPKYLLLLQLTSPFRDPSIIADAIENIVNDSQIPAIVSGLISDKRSEKTIGLSGDLLMSSDNNQPNDLVDADGNFYIVKISSLIKENTFFPVGTKVILSSGEQAIDIDTEADYQQALSALPFESF